MPFEITVEKVYAALMGADALGRYYKTCKDSYSRCLCNEIIY